MKPLVSIITPSYNQGKFIRETIESVLSQDYEDIEYIIIDGGSTDNTVDIVKEYKNRLTFIMEQDNGQSNAINKGFKMAKGEIVAWLNSDDVYESCCIRRVVEEFEKNTKLGLLYGEGYIIDENSNKIRIFEHTQEFDYWKLVNFWDYIMQPTTFFKKTYLKKVGYLDEQLHYCMDWDLWIKLAAVAEVKYIPDLLACSREYADTKTNTGGDKRLEEIVCLLQKYSGKEKPLGVKSYRASSFYIKHMGDMWFFKKLVGHYLTYVHKRLYKQLPFKDEEGRIGKRYALVVPGTVQKITISVENAVQNITRQKVSIYINQKKVKEKKINRIGKEIIVLKLQSDNFLNEIVLKCSTGVNIGAVNKQKFYLKIININYE